MTEGERGTLRTELVEAISDFSEDCRATSWGEEALHDAWDVAEGSEDRRFGMHVPFPWQPDLFRSLRDRLGEWPSGHPEDGAAWMDLDAFATLHSEYRERRERERRERVEALRAEPLSDDDLDVLRIVLDSTDAGRDSLLGHGENVGIGRFGSLARLAAHGLAEKTGDTVFDYRATSAGRDRLAEAASSPRL